MRIIISEEQVNKLKNFKPSKFFDNLYKTNLSYEYDLRPYNEDEIWDKWMKYSNNGNFDGDIEPFLEVLKILPKSFPYIDVSKLNLDQKKDILLGMVSGFNPEDIYYFTVLKIKYHNNIEQHNLEQQLPKEVVKNINWVLSPSSIEIIKNKFNLI